MEETIPSNNELLTDLKRVATLLEKNSLKIDEYKKLGKYSSKTIRLRFESWNKAIKAAGLFPVVGKFNNEDLLNDLRNIAQKLNLQTISKKEYNANSTYHSRNFNRRFRGWNHALQMAGLQPAPPPKTYNSDELIADLKTIAQKLNSNTLSEREYKNNGGTYSTQLYYKRFGGWSKAQKKAGLKAYVPAKKITKKELLEDLKRVATQLECKTISADEYKAHSGKYGVSAFYERFGSWNSAVKLIGLKPIYSNFLDDEKLLNDLKRVAELLGKKDLTYLEYRKNSGIYDNVTFANHFGSWVKARAKAGLKKPSGKSKIKQATMLNDLKKVSEQLTTNDKFTGKYYLNHSGQYSLPTITHSFGGWKKALKKAGIVFWQEQKIE